jgi:hypothetical protein
MKDRRKECGWDKKEDDENVTCVDDDRGQDTEV